MLGPLYQNLTPVDNIESCTTTVESLFNDDETSNVTISLEYFQNLYRKNLILELIASSIAERAEDGRFTLCDEKYVCKLLGLDYKALKEVSQKKQKEGDTSNE